MLSTAAGILIAAYISGLLYGGFRIIDEKTYEPIGWGFVTVALILGGGIIASVMVGYAN